MKIRLVGSEKFHADGRTHRHDESKFYKPEDNPKGLKHVATLIVYSLTLHHIVV